MNEVWIVQKQRVDYDDYPIGQSYDKVGTFSSREAAQQYISDVYPYDSRLYRRVGLNAGETITAVNVLSGVRPVDG